MARPKGSPNKYTRDLRVMISQALMKAGGVAYLKRQATENPGAFLGLVGKTLPKDVTVRTPDGLNLEIHLSR